MAFNYTEESLDNLNKNQLVELFLDLQSYATETINKLTGEIHYQWQCQVRSLREGGEAYIVTHKNDLQKKFPNAYCE